MCGIISLALYKMNFFQQVYVLDEQKQLVMVMGLKPTDVEKSMDNITT